MHRKSQFLLSCESCLVLFWVLFCFVLFEIFTFPKVERKFPESPCVIPFDMKKSGNVAL